jgi:nucleotide-binding universal stress UspA family protein
VPWITIVVGVDPSEAGVEAAQAGWEFARATGATCRLVHGVRDVWASGRTGIGDLTSLTADVEYAARLTVEEALRGQVPDHLVATLEVRTGSPVAVIRDFAREVDADVVVVGGKRHGTIARWLGGSTAKNVVRGLSFPVLVTTSPRLPRKVLVALDLSEAAAPTLAAAEEVARHCGASLRVVHAIEPIPYAGEGIPFVDVASATAQTEEAFRSLVAAKATLPAEIVVRRGTAVAVLEEEALTWPADLLVVGAHGKSRVERFLLGSVSEGLVNSLPTSVLVVRESAR